MEKRSDEHVFSKHVINESYIWCNITAVNTVAILIITKSTYNKQVPLDD